MLKQWNLNKNFLLLLTKEIKKIMQLLAHSSDVYLGPCQIQQFKNTWRLKAKIYLCNYSARIREIMEQRDYRQSDKCSAHLMLLLYTTIFQIVMILLLLLIQVTFVEPWRETLHALKIVDETRKSICKYLYPFIYTNNFLISINPLIWLFKLI